MYRCYRVYEVGCRREEAEGRVLACVTRFTAERQSPKGKLVVAVVDNRLRQQRVLVVEVVLQTVVTMAVVRECCSRSTTSSQFPSRSILLNSSAASARSGQNSMIACGQLRTMYNRHTDQRSSIESNLHVPAIPGSRTSFPTHVRTTAPHSGPAKSVSRSRIARSSLSFLPFTPFSTANHDHQSSHFRHVRFHTSTSPLPSLTNPPPQRRRSLWIPNPRSTRWRQALRSSIALHQCSHHLLRRRWCFPTIGT